MAETATAIAGAVVRPRLRGWLHLASAPVALTVGIAVLLRAESAAGRLSGAAFGGAAVLLFTVSGVYNLRAWVGRSGVWLRRCDHASIYVLIAGSYTGFGVVLLDGTARVVLLVAAWGGAGLGVALRLAFPDAPRWARTASYLALGWVAVLFGPQLTAAAGLTVALLLAAGGVLYTIGAVVYARRAPDPWPAWFGFHEVFHSFTVVAFAAHCTGLLLIPVR
ncbi:MAG TPA: hemolysin III family protein [Nocardioides sp.]|nr:hemolysin III family protein [Nocardioides sp.]